MNTFSYMQKPGYSNFTGLQDMDNSWETTDEVISPTFSTTPKKEPKNMEFLQSLTNLFGGVITNVTQKKTGLAADVKAVCGNRPLTNFGGKRDAYLACAQNFANQQAAIAGAAVGVTPPAKSGLGTGAIIGLSVAGVAVLGTIIFLAVKK